MPPAPKYKILKTKLPCFGTPEPSGKYAQVNTAGYKGYQYRRIQAEAIKAGGRQREASPGQYRRAEAGGWSRGGGGRKEGGAEG